MSITLTTVNGFPAYVDNDTSETVLPIAPLVWSEDFADVPGLPWARLDSQPFESFLEHPSYRRMLGFVSGQDIPSTDVGQDITLASNITDEHNGVYRLQVSNTSEYQEDGIYWANRRQLDASKRLSIEARIAFPTLPTGKGGELTEAVFGLVSDHTNMLDAVQVNAWFRWNGSGYVLAETDDGTMDTDAMAAGVTCAVGVHSIFRIDIFNAQAKFYINGAEVATGSLAGITDSIAQLQPYVRLVKRVTSSNTSEGAMDIDYVKVWQARA